MPRRHSQSGATLIWLIIWLVGMATIAYWCVTRHVPALQQQIQSNAQAAVADARARDVTVSVDGRNVILKGVVSSETEKAQLVSAVGAAAGVRDVYQDQLAVISTTTADQQTDKVDVQPGQIIHLDVPAPPPMDAPPLNVPAMDAPPMDVPPLDVPPIDAPPIDVPPLDVPPTDVPPMEVPPMDAPPLDVPPMDVVAPPVSSDSVEVDLSMLSDNVEAKALALIEQARSKKSNGIAGSQQTTAPAVRPSFTMQIGDETLTLNGNISDQDNLLQLIESAMNTFGANYVVNSVNVDKQTARADWLPTVIEFLPNMQPLSNAGIEITGSQITLLGVATDVKSHDKIIDVALSDLKELSLVERISVSEAIQANNNIASTTSAPAKSEIQRAELKKTFDGLQEADILFESGSNVLTEKSRVVVETIGRIFAQYPDIKIEINGHTDSSGASSKNLQLSQLRANAVRDYLIELGINATRLSAYGFGDGVPIADNESAAGRKLNRRIEFNF